MQPPLAAAGLIALLACAVLGDTVYRASGPVSASSGKGCGYDQALLQHVCLACNTSHCIVYSIKYRSNPVIERADIPLSTPSVLSFTVRTGRRLAYIYFSNNSLIQYNLDNWRAAPLDTGFAYNSATSTACGTVTLTAPVRMTVTPDGRAYGILTTSANCANTLHVVEFDVPPPGATTGGASTSTTVITYAAQATPGTVTAIAASSRSSSTSGTFFVAMTSGSCSGTSYAKIVPRGSSPSATQLTCASATCSFSATTVSGIMLDYMDFGDTLIATHSACNTLVGITSSGTLKVLAGNGQSGYQDGYATSEARVATPSSPAVTARRVFLLTTDTDTAFLVGRLTGATNTESMSKSRSPQSVSEALSSTTTETYSTTLSPSRTPTGSPTDIATASPSVSASPTPSDVTHTMESSVTSTTSRTPSGTIASPSQSITHMFSTTQSRSNSHSDSDVASSTGTRDVSQSRSISQSTSASRSITVSAGNTSASAPLSTSQTVTGMMSLTRTNSATASPSFTRRRQNTRSWMASASTTDSGTPSKTNSPSAQDSATISKQRTSQTGSPSKASVSGFLTVSMMALSQSRSVASPTASYTARESSSPSISMSHSPSMVQSSTVSEAGGTAKGLIVLTASLSASRSIASLSMDASMSATYVVSTSFTTAASASSSSSASTSMTVTLTTTRPLFYPTVGGTEGWKSILGGVVGAVVGLSILGGLVAAKKAGMFGSTLVSTQTSGQAGHASPTGTMHGSTPKHSPTASSAVRAPSAGAASFQRAPSSINDTPSGVRYATVTKMPPPTQQTPLDDAEVEHEPFDVIDVRGETPHSAEDLEAEGDGHTLPWWATGGAPPPPIYRVPAAAPTSTPVTATSSTALRRLLEMQDVSFGGNADIAPTAAGSHRAPTRGRALPPHSDFEALDEDSGDDTLWFENEDHQPH